MYGMKHGSLSRVDHCMPPQGHAMGSGLLGHGVVFDIETVKPTDLFGNCTLGWGHLPMMS